MMIKGTHWRLVASFLAFFSAIVYAGFPVSTTGVKCGDGEESQAGSSPGDGGKDNSDPIYLASGDFQRTETDLHIPGRGLDFEFKRMYRSRSSLFAELTVPPGFDPTTAATEIGHAEIVARSPLGIGWEHKYNMRIDLNQDGGVEIGPIPTGGGGGESPEPVGVTVDNEPSEIYLYDGTGRFDLFDVYTTHDAIATDPALYANEKFSAVIRYTTYSDYIEMYDENQIRYRFFPFYSSIDENVIIPFAGRLQSITDRNGNQLEFFYETSNGVERLASMEDTLGHTINFFYHDDAGSPLSSSYPADHVAHLLWQVVDHANRVVDYDYENVTGDYEAKLVTATLPNIENTVDFPLQYTSANTVIDHGRFITGRSWQYEYAPALSVGWLRDGMLTKITDPNGIVIVENKYDTVGVAVDRRAYGRVVRQKYGDEAYNYVWMDDENNLMSSTNSKDYFVWVNDRRGAITRFKYAQGSLTYQPGEPRDMQLLEKIEFLGFVDDPDLRVFATINTTTGDIDEWKQIDSSGTVSALTGSQPHSELKTVFTPTSPWNNAGVTSPNGIITTNTYQSEDYPPASGDFPNPQFNRTVTSRTMSSPDGVTPAVSITENWRYDFDFGGSGCGCGSSGHYTAYKDGEGNVTRKVYDQTINTITARANGNLLAEYRGLPSSYFTASLGVNVANDAVSIDEYDYNQWGQMVEHTHPTKRIINETTGIEELHPRVDQFVYYSDTSDLANYGRLKSIHVDVNGFNLTTLYEYDLIGNVIKQTSPGGDVAKYLYNQASQLVRVQQLDSSDNLYTERMFFYDANGNMVVEEELNLDGDQNVVSSNTDKWFTTVNIYDKLDFLTEKSRELTGVTGIFTSYDSILTSNRALSQATNGNYLTQRWSYDANQNLIKFEDGEAVSGGLTGSVTEHEYDARDLRIETVDGVGSSAPLKTKFVYDDNGRLAKTVVNPDDLLALQETGYLYDWFNRVITVSDPMGNEFIYTYDDNHSVLTAAACGPIGEDTTGNESLYTLASIENLYDTLDRPYSQSVKAFEYDYATQPISGEACGVVPAGSSELTTSTVYNADSSIRKMSSPSGNSLQQRVANYFYDTASRVELTEDIAGNITQYEYDADSNVAKSIRTEVSSLNGSFEVFEASYEYMDALDRRTASIDGVGNRTELKYDSRSNLVEKMDARNNLDAYTYDSLSRPTATSLGNGEVTTSKMYDASSRLISEADANSNTTGYEYDGLNRLTKIIMPDGEFYQAQYDANGNMSQYTDARGVILDQTFDLNNRLVARDLNASGTQVPGMTEEDYTYDGLSRLRTATNDFSKITREYDSRSNITREFQNIDAVGSFPATSDREVAYEFDLANNTTKLTYPGGRDVYRTFDELNRMAGIFNDDLFADPVTEFEYIGRRLQRREHGNGTRTDYIYNGIDDGAGGVTNAAGDFGFGRVAEISTTKVSSSTVLDEFAFAWDKTQNRTAYNDIGSGMKNRRERTFGYDAANRMVSTDVDFPNPLTDFTSPTNNGITTYTLDGVYNRTDVSGFESNGAPIGTYSQTLDQAKNNQYTITPRAEGGEWMNFHDKNGNLIEKYQITIADFNGDHAVNFFDVSAFLAAFNLEDASADLNGDGVWNFFDVNEFLGANSALDGTALEQWYYTYDFRNQLIEAKQVFGVSDVTLVTTNTYDSAARRVIESVDVDGDGTEDTARHLIYGCASLWEVIEQIDIATDTTMMTHVYGLGIDDEVSYQYEDQSIFIDIWTHRDDLNSLTSITDSNGDVKERYEYGDFGKVAFFDEAGVSLPSSSFNAQHLYTGRSIIAGTGLYDYRFRVMEPETGGFNQRDPLGMSGGSSNIYTYVIANPSRFTDPFGLEPSGDCEQGECDQSNAESEHESGLPPCLDARGCPVVLTFNGKSLVNAEGGGVPAVSGVPVNTSGDPGDIARDFDYSDQRQDVRNIGPTPEGEYYMESNDEDSAAAGSSRHTRDTYVNGRGAWGDYSWPLSPTNGTDLKDTNGKDRDGFFVHGGERPGSGGCIDCYRSRDGTEGGEYEVKRMMDKIRERNPKPCYIKVIVDYTNTPTHTTNTDR